MAIYKIDSDTLEKAAKLLESYHGAYSVYQSTEEPLSKEDVIKARNNINSRPVAVTLNHERVGKFTKTKEQKQAQKLAAKLRKDFNLPLKKTKRKNNDSRNSPPLY